MEAGFQPASEGGILPPVRSQIRGWPPSRLRGAMARREGGYDRVFFPISLCGGLPLDKDVRMVFLYYMNKGIGTEGIAEIQAQPRAMIRRQVQEWFGWMDHILDVHRSHFVFREPAPVQLEEHKQLLKEGIRTCLLFNAVIADPDFNEPDLTVRLHVRIRQLKDAYDTFHDGTLSDEQAEKILQQVFPE